MLREVFSLMKNVFQSNILWSFQFHEKCFYKSVLQSAPSLRRIVQKRKPSDWIPLPACSRTKSVWYENKPVSWQCQKSHKGSRMMTTRMPISTSNSDAQNRAKSPYETLLFLSLLLTARLAPLFCKVMFVLPQWQKDIFHERCSWFRIIDASLCSTAPVSFLGFYSSQPSYTFWNTRPAACHKTLCLAKL